VTLYELERCNGRYFALFYRIRQLWDNYVKVAEDRTILAVCDKKSSPETQILAIYDLSRYSQRFLRTNSLDKAPLLKSINTAWCLANDARQYSPTGNRIRAFHWYQNQWPRMTLNGVMTADPCYLCGSWASCIICRFCKKLTILTYPYGQLRPIIIIILRSSTRHIQNCRNVGYLYTFSFSSYVTALRR